jgi:hypothetical protein
MNIDFSIILGFRDRDIWRLEACLKSLASQENSPTYEIIVLDYGSSSNYRTGAENLCQTLGSLVRYAHAPTQGQPWNRSQALNLGAALAAGTMLVFGDIDLLYSPLFLAGLHNTVQTGKKYNYRCRYMPEGSQVTTFQQAQREHSNADLSKDTGLGLTVVYQSDFEKIGGYDERFLIWGIEDNAFQYRAEKIGLSHAWIEGEEAVTYHIWHPNSGKQIHKNWYARMWTMYENTRHLPPLRLSNWAQILERPLLKDRKADREFSLNDDLLSKTHAFYSTFIDLPVNQVVCVQGIVPYVTNHPLITAANTILKKLSIGYHLETNIHQEGKSEQLGVYRDWMLYFLLYQKELLQDFYMEESDSTIKLYFIKK